MSIKSILVPFSGTREEMPAVNTAFSIGQNDGAHIRGVYIAPEVGGILYSNYEKAWMEMEHTEHSRMALTRFEHFAVQHHVPLVAPGDITQGVSASFSVVGGSYRGAVSYYGKISDMIIVDRAIQEFGETAKEPIISAVMDTGKATLLLPANHSYILGDSVLIAWNGSRQAARAVSDALPILRHALKVYIMTDGAIKKHLPDAAALASYLKMHGIAAKTAHIGEEADGDDNTASLLTEEALKLKCKLIVMGAFTHHPLKQMVLGGITRMMLEASNIPVLMAS